MALQVILAGQDVTASAAGLTFSNVDPGGYEACSFTLPAAVAQPKPGDPIRIHDGLGVAWWGQVEDPGPVEANRRAEGQVQGVGDGVALKDDPYQMIYVDRDLTRWGQPAVSRQATLVAANHTLGSLTAAPDTANGLPSVIETITDTWDAPLLPIVEAVYDAGPGNLVAVVYYSLRTQNADDGGTSWRHFVILSSDDIQTTIESTANLNAGSGTSPVSAYFAPATPYRYAVLSAAYAATPGGTAGQSYLTNWHNPAVYGPHGLTRRGADPGGLYAEDIAQHALTQTQGIDTGIIDATGFTVLHAVYRDPTLPEKTIDDMGTLAGVHWGVWEPLSMLGARPRLDFRARPTAATCVVSRGDCDGLAISERRSQLYNACVVTYTDAAGKAGQVTVTADNIRMPAGLTRTLGPLSMGIASSAAAQAYAADALALAQSGQRGGGSPTLPSNVLIPGGGSRPAHLLKAGLDRLKVTDLPDSGSWTEADTRRFDTFRIKRCETTVTHGTPRTRVELDEGADLMEVLNADLAIRATTAGP